MDPRKTLREIKSLALFILEQDDDSHGAKRLDVDVQAVELAERILDLDEWMRKGGLSPWAQP